METTTTNKCEHCGAAIKEYVFKFDVLDALLLVAMARRVKDRHAKGLEFTAANQVHVPDMQDVSLAVRCRTTQCSKLGLVAKVKKDGRQIRGVWSITKRGWAALRGEEVPAEVKVFRNEITERPDRLITLRRAFNVHRDQVEAAIARKKQPAKDYRELAAAYGPEEWVHFENMVLPRPTAHTGTVEKQNTLFGNE